LNRSISFEQQTIQDPKMQNIMATSDDDT